MADVIVVNRWCYSSLVGLCQFVVVDSN